MQDKSKAHSQDTVTITGKHTAFVMDETDTELYYIKLEERLEQ